MGKILLCFLCVYVFKCYQIGIDVDSFHPVMKGSAFEKVKELGVRWRQIY